MPKEIFPVKKPGDPLFASEINQLSRIAGNLSGVNQGTGLQGTSGWITGVAGKVGPFVLAAKVRKPDDDTAGIYQIRFRYWDSQSLLWKDEEDDHDLDARCFSKDAADPQHAPKLVYGDLLTVRYCGQRGVWLPVQFLFPDSRWAWIPSGIAARSGATEYSGTARLVKQTLNSAGTQSTWTYLLDHQDNQITVTCFNGFPDAIPSGVHARIGWNSLGQYEVKGVPCSDDTELPS